MTATTGTGKAHLKAALTMLLLLCGACGTWRKPELVTLPPGFVGWVRIDYGLSDAEPLREKDGYLRVEVPPSGRVRTSTALSTGLAADRYEYRDASGYKTQLTIASRDEDSNGSVRSLQYVFVPKLEDQNERNIRVFFVGTRDEFRKLRARQPEIPER